MLFSLTLQGVSVPLPFVVVGLERLSLGYVLYGYDTFVLRQAFHELNCEHYDQFMNL